MKPKISPRWEKVRAMFPTMTPPMLVYCVFSWVVPHSFGVRSRSKFATSSGTIEEEGETHGSQVASSGINIQDSPMARTEKFGEQTSSRKRRNTGAHGGPGAQHFEDQAPVTPTPIGSSGSLIV
ncbi:hypothetical protein C5167_001862 [Papaver somniferum]|uniref:Uncharacterized protein n=1 Tax=Papaver somniferum TaxID=3469 RepID=A0A4Y7KZG8_PAPSO|nr:uncharacterized protein LOC113309620 [Papaver somniferum]RZC77491.1 hypothetical protein C5167_001862 [Papaver somniferum]